MTAPGLVVGLVMIAAGVLVGAAGVLGRLDRLPRNGLVGIRTPSTLASDEAWHRAHRAAWLPTLLAGLVAVLAGLAAALVSSENAVAAVTLTGAGLLLVLVVLAGVVGSRAARKR